MRTVHGNYWGSRRPPPQAKPVEPPPQQKEETQKQDPTGYWIGGLSAYQGGGPPLGFEETGLTLLGLRGDVGRGDATKDENSNSNASRHSAQSDARDIRGLTRH